MALKRFAKRSAKNCGGDMAADALIADALIADALIELFHLFGNSRAEMETAWSFLRSGAVVVGTIDDSEMAQLRALMLQYWDRPMDFADATLVHLAKRESISTILTVDQADFARYRLAGKRRFHVLPIDRP